MITHEFVKRVRNIFGGMTDQRVAWKFLYNHFWYQSHFQLDFYKLRRPQGPCSPQFDEGRTVSSRSHIKVSVVAIGILWEMQNLLWKFPPLRTWSLILSGRVKSPNTSIRWTKTHWSLQDTNLWTNIFSFLRANLVVAVKLSWFKTHLFQFDDWRFKVIYKASNSDDHFLWRCE